MRPPTASPRLCSGSAICCYSHLPERLRVDELLEEGEGAAVQPDVHVVLCDVQVEVAALLGVGVQQLIRVGLYKEDRGEDDTKFGHFNRCQWQSIMK